MIRSTRIRRNVATGVLSFIAALVVTAQQPASLLPAEPLIFAGSGPGGGLVRVFQADGTQLGTAAPFGAGFTGGVRVAAGDVNGDGVTDAIVGMASGGNHVRVYSGADAATLLDVAPFGASFTGGVFVAAGDVNGDAHADILVGAGIGSGLAKLIDGATLSEVGQGYPFGLAFTGGITVALGDLTGDGGADIVVGMAVGGFVRVFDGATIAELAAGFPYGLLFTGGVNVAMGDVDGDGVAEVVTAPRNAGGPVQVYSATGAVLGSGSPFGEVNGVSVAVVDINEDGRGDLVTAPGSGEPRLRVFSVLEQTELLNTLAFEALFTGGVNVGASGPIGTRFTSANATTFTVGVAGSFEVTTVNGPDITLTVGGTLPAGVGFADHGDGTGTLSGTPEAGSGGVYALTLVASRGAAQVASQPFTLTVLQPPIITSGNATTFTIGHANTFAVLTSAHPTATLSATGALPGGVTFVANANGTATVSGSPEPGSEGTYPLVITASNGVGSDAVQDFTLTIVGSGTPIITSSDHTTFTVGAPGSFAVTTSANPAVTMLTVTGVLPAGVTYTDHGNGSGTMAGIPDPGTAGTYPLTVTADNGVGIAVQDFILTVAPIGGGAPQFTSANALTVQTTVVMNFAVTTSGTPAVTTITRTGALPTGVAFTDHGDGTASLTGTPEAGTAGLYPLEFTATNGIGTATQAFVLTVTNAGAVPMFTSGATTAFVIGSAGNFAITTAASPPVTTITITGTLPATVTFADHGNGTAALAGTPQAGTAGSYALIFTATNGVGAPVQQHFILNVHEAPSVTSAASTSFTIGQANSFNVTTAGLPIPTIVQSGALPTGVSYVDNGDGTGTLAGNPPPAAAGSYPLTFTATNGIGAPAVQSFTLHVVASNPPTLDAIASPAAIDEDTGQQTINLAGITAGTGETQPLQVTATSDNPALIPNPTVTYISPNATGSLAYTPVVNASGTAVVTVTVTDGGLDLDLGTAGDNAVVSRTFTVTVNAINDLPTLDAIPNPVAIDENSPQQTINLAGISAGGGESQPLHVTAVSDNTGLIPNPTVTYVSPNTTGSLAYTPVAGQSGTAIVTVTVTDGGLDGNLGTAGDNGVVTRTFTVTVSVVDDPPTLDAIADPAAINEDAAPQTVNLSGISAGPGDTATLTVTAQSSNPGLIPHPTVTYTSPNPTGSLAYTPVVDTSGSALITVTVSDGVLDIQRTFTVTVNPVNDAPTFTPGVDQAVSEDAPPQTVNSFLGTVSAGPNEAGQLITVTVTNVTNTTLFAVQPAISASGVLTYTPAANQFGASTVTYSVSDNGGTANGGDDTVGPLTFTITITAVNDAPTLDVIANPAAILEDAAQQTVNLTGISAGPAESAQPLQVTAVSDNTGVIPNPTVTYTSPNATGSLAYTTVVNASGSAQITVTVTDGGPDNDLGTAGDNATLVRNFTVTVTAVNDAPSFTKGADQTVNEDSAPQTVNGWATAISAGPNEGSQTVAFEITINTNTGLFSAQPAVSAAGVLTYTPAANQNGTATITLRITDNGGTANGGVDVSATQSFAINVTAVNDPPVAQNKNYAAQANLRINGLSGLLTGVTDADAGINGCTPSFSVNGVSVTSPAGGIITNLNAAAGTFDFEPPPGVVGNVTFTYTVADTGCPGTATSSPATATVAVAGPVIWFVDSTAPAGGNGTWTGTNAKAFQTLAQAAAVDASDHRIFVLNNSGTSITYAGGIVLNTGEWLVGHGVAGASFDSVMGIAPPLGTVARPGVGGVRPTFSGTVQVNTRSASNIVKLLGFNLATGASTGLTNAGTTLNGVTVDIGSVTTSTGTAVSVTGTNNGATAANAFKFISVSSNGAANGIDLRNATGTFEVTGDGTNVALGGNGSGGTITNAAGADGATAGNAIYLENAQNVTLRRMTINGTNQNHGIRGVGVNGFTLEFSTVTGTNGTSQGLDEGSVNFDNLTGAAAITSALIEGGFEDNLNVVNTSGTLNRLTITGSTFGFNNTVNGNNNILIEAQNAGTTLNFTLQSSTIKGARADWINSGANSGSSINAIVGGSTPALGNTFDNLAPNAHPGAAPGGNRIVLASIGSMTVDVRNNTLKGSKGGAIFVRSSGTALGQTGSLTGHVRDNIVGVAAIANSGSAEGSGIGVFGDGGSDMTLVVTNNQVFQYNNSGISIIFGDELNDGSVFNVTVTGNTVSNPGNILTDFNAIHLNNGTVAATDNFTSCVDIGGAGVGNSVAGGGKGATPPNNTDIRLRQRQMTTVRLPGYAGANTDVAAVATYLAGRNTLTTAAASTTSPPGGGFIGGAACAVP